MANEVCLKIADLHCASCIKDLYHFFIHLRAQKFFTVSGLSEIFKENCAVN